MSEPAGDREAAPAAPAAPRPSAADRTTRHHQSGVTIQQRFERVLAASRLLALIPVVFLLLDAAGSFIYGADILIRTGDGDFGEPSKVGGRLGVFLVVMDTFLVGATLMIAAFGFYELFVLRRERAVHKYWLPNWLQMRDLEDLKARVVSMLILVAAITFVDMLVETHELRGILFLGIGIAVIILALTAFLRFGRKARAVDSGGAERGAESGAGTLAIGQPAPASAAPDQPERPPAASAEPTSRRARVIAVLSSSARECDTSAADQCDVTAIAGTATLDLRKARVSPQLTMRIRAILGIVTVIVPPEMRVADSGMTLLGTRSVAGSSAGAGQATLEITGSSILSRVRVIRRP